MNKIAVGYCRFSCDKQRDESIEAQQEAIERFARQEGLIIARWYIDRAYSATNDNRPEFQRMIADSEKKEFRFVITHKRDRFSRGEYDPAIYKKRLQDNKVKVLYAGESNLTGYAGVILDKVLEGMAAGYSINLSTEVRKGMRMNAKKAQCNGGLPPYGYKRVYRKNDKGEPVFSSRGKVINDTVIDPLKAEAVKTIFNMTVGGFTQSDILAELNAKGFKATNGKPFIKQVLDKILRNERYTGTYIFNPSKKHKAQECLTDSDLPEDSEHRTICVDDGLPQIVSHDIFNAVQVILDGRKHKPSTRSKVDYLLTGRVVCGECGEHFSGSSHYKGGKPYHLYRCQNCKMTSVRKDPLEKFVMDEMARIVHNEEFVTQILDRFVEFYREKTNNNDVVARLEMQLADVDGKIENLTNAIAGGGHFGTLNSKLNALANEKTEILASLKSESSVNLDEFVTKEEIRRTYFRVLGLLESGETHDKSAIVNTLLNRIIVFKDRVAVFINLLPLTNATTDLQITDKDLMSYGLLETDTNQNTATMCGIPSERLFGDLRKIVGFGRRGPSVSLKQDCKRPRGQARASFRKIKNPQIRGKEF